MGCDIHFHTEVKINGVWHHYSKPMINRDYELFGILAGVRNSFVKPIKTDNKLPNDLTLITKLSLEKMKEYSHSHRCFNTEDIEEAYNRLGESLEWEYNIEYLFREDWRDPPKEVEDVRWIFWFDN